MIFIPKRFGSLEKKLLKLLLVKNVSGSREELSRMLNQNTSLYSRTVVNRLLSFGILTKDEAGLIALSQRAKTILDRPTRS